MHHLASAAESHPRGPEGEARIEPPALTGSCQGTTVYVRRMYGGVRGGRVTAPLSRSVASAPDHMALAGARAVALTPRENHEFAVALPDDASFSVFVVARVPALRIAIGGVPNCHVSNPATIIPPGAAVKTPVHHRVQSFYLQTIWIAVTNPS